MSKKAGRNALFWCDDVNDGKKNRWEVWEREVLYLYPNFWDRSAQSAKTHYARSGWVWGKWKISDWLPHVTPGQSCSRAAPKNNDICRWGTSAPNCAFMIGP